MTKLILLSVGLFPTVVVFMFGSPWLGLFIGIILLVLFSLVWFTYKLSMKSLMRAIEEEFNISEEEIQDRLTEDKMRIATRDVLRKILEGRD